MSEPIASAYDSISYVSVAYPDTHPNRLATIARFYGMEAPDVASCRVRELGCGSGRNLLPMAYQYPDGRFVGIDLSIREIETARSRAASYGLTNVELRHGDILEVDSTWEQFDYILAHGVYSWVPPEVREKILAIFQQNLSPCGVAYVSYNAYPGSHLRNLTRDMMHYHIRHMDDPKRRIAQARAVIGMIAEGSDASSVHGAIMRDQLALLQRMPDELLFHDDLLEITKPFLLHEVVEKAQGYGLQYLSDAVLSRRDLGHHSEQIRRVLESFPEDEFLARDQYQDFVDGHGFRRTLLCHADVPLNRRLEPDCIAGFHLASSAAPVSGDSDPTSGETAEFNTERGHKLATDHSLTKAAILELGDAWPGMLAFPALVERAAGRAGLHLDGSEGALEHVAVLTNALFHAVCSGHVEIHKHAPKLTKSISRKPEASLLARKEVESEALVTNLRHKMVRIDDKKVRRFLPLVDGTRDCDELVRDFVALTPAADAQVGATRADIEQNLRLMANLGLLVQ
jgi:SAM-dependent methyltransferase